MVVDGLRSDALVEYLRVLRERDYEPQWRSGLALLGEAGFTLATSTRAEAPFPAGSLAATATLVTGAFPDTHGVAGTRFVASGDDGRKRAFDFTRAADAGRIYFSDGYRAPTGAPTGLSRLLRTPTVYERLAPTHRSAVVFHGFGHGAEWYVPADVGATVVSLIPDETGAAATPLLDAGTRAAATDLLLGPDPPDLITLAFRGALTESCLQPDADCGGPRGDLTAIQRGALHALDSHLWHLLRKYRAAHPNAFGRTTLLLVGTGGVVDRRGEGGRGVHALSADATLDHLAGHGADGCADWLRGARAAGELEFSGNGGSAQLTVRRGPPGQRHLAAWRLGCLAGASLAAIDDGDRLAGGAWLGPEALGKPGPRATRVTVHLRPVFEGALPAHRRERTRLKIRRTFDDAPERRTGDVLLFAEARKFESRIVRI